jgi:hypothetical protein
LREGETVPVFYWDYLDAKRRGERAKKLFDKEVMGEIIGGCKISDMGDDAGGFKVFYDVCRVAITPSEEGITEIELDEFIHEMWEAAKCARRYQQCIPCW